MSAKCGVRGAVHDIPHTAHRTPHRDFMHHLYV
jgi:hypothetical protein